MFNEKDLIKIYFKWKSNFLEMSEIEKRDLYKEELKASKDQLSFSMYELSKFSEKLSDHKKHIVRYHLAISRLNKLREKIQVLGLEQLDLVIDLYHGSRKLR